MSVGADALYQYLDPLHYTLLATLRTLHAQACWRDAVPLPVAAGAVVDLEVTDDELAARLHCSLNTLRARRRAIQQGATPVAVLIHGVEAITERYGSLNAIRCWRWRFCYIDPELTPAIVERAAVLARQRGHGPGVRSRRASACITVDDRRMELKRQRQAKRITKRAPGRATQRPDGSNVDDPRGRSRRRVVATGASSITVRPDEIPPREPSVRSTTAPHRPGGATIVRRPDLDASRASDASERAVPPCDATSRRLSGTEVPKTGTPGVPRVGTPGAPTDGAPGAPIIGAPRAPECGAPGVPAAGAPRTPGRGLPGSPVAANDMYTTCCYIETDVQKHVVHARHSRKSASDPATGRADAASRVSGPYDHYRQALLASTAASAADLAAFEEFLDREVTGRLGTDPLTWSQYRAFFRYWAQLGDAQAAGIAADIRERAAAGRVRSPQAYLMWALKRRAARTERDSSSSPRPSVPPTVHDKLERHVSATLDEGGRLVARGGG